MSAIEGVTISRDCAARAASAAVVLLASLTIAPAAEYGALAPFEGLPTVPIAARDLEGAPLSIAAEPGRVTLVHFFASWCEPCVTELPELSRFAEERRGRVRFIGVNVAEPAVRAQKFAARFALPGPVALDEDKSIASAFRVRGLPATVLIAPGGATSLAAAGPLDWNSAETARALDGLARLDKKPQGEQP